VRALKVAVGLVVSVALLGALLWTVNLGALGHQLAGTQWGWALASAFFAIAGVWTRAQRWHYLFPPGTNPPALFRASMIGYMANNVLPLRAGELVRVYVVARHWSEGFWMPFATLVVERVLDGLAVVLILGSLLFVVQVPPPLRWAAGVFLGLDLAAVLVLVLAGAAPGACRAAIAGLTRRSPWLQTRSVAVFETLVRGLAGVQTARHAGPLLVWSFLVWLTAALAAWTALFAAHLHLPLVAAWAVLAFVGLGISLPSAPGYIGVFHTAAVLALTMFGVSSSLAFGYAILYHACGFIPITLFGWVLLLREHLSLGEAAHRPIGASEAG
jgi:glycosyltransferase 2 family protein